MDYFEGMLQRDADSFVRICNKLLSNCFLCRKNEEDRKDYYFLLKYRDRISDYFSIAGYRLEVNEEYGVAQLINPLNQNRFNFKLYESIMLLILRILYDEKKRELSASEDIIVTIGDIHDRFLTLEIRDKMIDKTTLRNALSTLRRFSIIETLDRDISDEAARIIIFDSILMAVRVDEINQVYEKLSAYRKRNGKDEETDEDQTD